MAAGNLGQQASLIPKFIALGEYQLAAEAIERALRAAPRALDQRPFDTVALYQLGEVLRQQGKTAEANQYLDEGQRELAQVSLKLHEKRGARVVTGLAEASAAKGD